MRVLRMLCTLRLSHIFHIYSQPLYNVLLFQKNACLLHVHKSKYVHSNIRHRFDKQVAYLKLIVHVLLSCIYKANHKVNLDYTASTERVKEALSDTFVFRKNSSGIKNRLAWVTTFSPGYGKLYVYMLTCVLTIVLQTN